MNSLPWMSVLRAPYMTLRPAPPRLTNRLPVSVRLVVAVNATLANGWVSAPHGQLPAGFEKVHMPWLRPSVMRRLLCTSEKPAGREGSFHVA